MGINPEGSDSVCKLTLQDIKDMRVALDVLSIHLKDDFELLGRVNEIKSILKSAVQQEEKPVGKI